MKIKCIVLILIIPLLLCGCSVKDFLKDSKTEYTVSSIGFETAKKGITIYFEALVVNSEDADSDVARTIFSGTGTSVNEAVSDALRKTAAPLNFGHTAIVFLQNGIPRDTFWEIYNFCREEPQISVAIGFVLCDDVAFLLEKDPSASLSVGYDIAYMLKTQTNRTKSGYYNRLYECVQRASLGYWRLPLVATGKGNFYLNSTANQII